MTGFFLKFARLLGTEESEKKEDRAIAVDLGQSHLLVLTLEKTSAKPMISHFRLERRPASPEAVSERLRVLFEEEAFDAKRVRVAFKGTGVVMRILTFPQMKRDEFASAIRFEVEKYIPFKSSEVMLDFQILSENILRGSAKLMEVLLVAVKQSEIYEWLRLFQNADLDVELIDLHGLAFANLLEFCHPEIQEAPVGFLDIGTETSSFGILLRGKPLFIRDITFGGSDLLKILKRKLSLEGEAVLALQKDPARAPSEYREVVEQGLSMFLRELKLSLAYYLDQIPGSRPIETLFLAGGGSRFKEAGGLLERELKVTVRRPEFLSRVQFNSHLDPSLLQGNEDLLPVAAGLCLR